MPLTMAKDGATETVLSRPPNRGYAFEAVPSTLCYHGYATKVLPVASRWPYRWRLNWQISKASKALLPKLMLSRLCYQGYATKAVLPRRCYQGHAIKVLLPRL